MHSAARASGSSSRRPSTGTTSASAGTPPTRAAATTSATTSRSSPSWRSSSRRPDVKVLAVSGSLRAGSHNTALLQEAARLAPAGVEVELWEGLGDLPIYDQDIDVDDAAESVRRLREDWGAADAILFATPEYNGSVPGGLKNAVDWASRPKGDAALLNKTVAVVGASI